MDRLWAVHGALFVVAFLYRPLPGCLHHRNERIQCLDLLLMIGPLAVVRLT
jgi:hypothetical protein